MWVLAPALPLGQCVTELPWPYCLCLYNGSAGPSSIEVGLDPLKETEKTEKKSCQTRNGVLGNG